MKTFQILFWTMTLLVACQKTVDSTSEESSNDNGTKLIKIEFTDPELRNQTEIWTLDYLDVKVTKILSSTGKRITLEYSGKNLSKINFFSSDNILIGYQELSYKADLLIDEKYFIKRGNKDVYELEYEHAYEYVGSTLKSKKRYGSERGSIYYDGHSNYNYDSKGNIYGMESYDEHNVYMGKYIYVSSMNENKFKNVISQVQALAIFTDYDPISLSDLDIQIKNQYLNINHITRETILDENNDQISLNDYNFIFNKAGYIVQKSTSFGHIIKYTYE